jgi:5-methylcytosine-specific restriction endonuclease McrA
MGDLLNSPVLVLNRGWVPIHIKCVKDAICDVVSDCAKIIDTEDEFLTMYEWSDWTLLEPNADSKVVHTIRQAIRLPEVIVLTDYNDVPELEIRLTRKNLLLRDNYCCQYCGKKVSNKDFTIDHIVPRSRGGVNSWDNFVVACFPCNIKKRDRTPKEAGIVLRSKPVKPKWYPLASRYTIHSPKSWERFLPKGKIPAIS